MTNNIKHNICIVLTGDILWNNCNTLFGFCYLETNSNYFSSTNFVSNTGSYISNTTSSKYENYDAAWHTIDNSNIKRTAISLNNHFGLFENSLDIIEIDKNHQKFQLIKTINNDDISKFLFM